MKKLMLLVGAILFASTLMVGDLFAYNYQYDTSFTRMQARAATTDAPDAVYYNAVGTVKMVDGLYLDLGNQLGAKRYSHKILFANYHDATPSFIMPNLALVWKKDKGSIFAEMHIPAGGGTLEYKKSTGIWSLMTEVAGLGLPIMPNKLKGTSFWIQGSVGGAFAFTDWLAVTASVKYAQYSYELAVGYIGLGNISKNKTSAGGFGGQGGIMITPMKELAITALYSTQIIARGTTRDLKTHYSYIDEARLPDYLLIGINVKPTETLSIQASYQLTFSQQRNYGSSYAWDMAAGTLLHEFSYSYMMNILAPTTALGGNIQDYKMKMAHKVALGGEMLVHKMLALSIGASFESQDTHPRVQVPFDPGLANIGVGLGMKIIATDRFSIQLGAARYFYFTEKMMFGLIKMNKEVWSFGIGLTGKII
ncbi:MAG TPA: hypothetical protein PLA65_17110 [Spirochaetota bacterium]|nr:hypothetical protein [Spirochaetota bacterium]HOD15913.1 hypothetical protein [Spirochaetota bacterium]HPG51981.1 hypothetical protein [Spirochaetota bacterium]HPN13780.1 hypothetical protein [Spirochaetota bacterium]